MLGELEGPRLRLLDAAVPGSGSGDPLRRIAGKHSFAAQRTVIAQAAPGPILGGRRCLKKCEDIESLGLKRPKKPYGYVGSVQHVARQNRSADAAYEKRIFVSF